MKKSNWPAAIFAIIGTLGICAAVAITKNGNCLWAMLLVLWITDILREV